MTMTIPFSQDQRQSLPVSNPKQTSPRNHHRVAATALLLLCIPLPSPGQTPNPPTPSKEYIRLGSQIIAIENGSSSTTSGSCQLSSSAKSFGASGGGDTITVTAAGSGCSSWTATVSGSAQSWINITSGASGSGNGAVSFTVSANTGSSSRTGVITIAGLSFTITQQGVVSSVPAGLVFVPLSTPCNVVASTVLQPNTTSIFTIAGTPCVPASAQAFSLDVTVQGNGGGVSFISIWPGNGVPSSGSYTGGTASTINDPTGVVNTNAVLVAAGANGTISLYTTDPAIISIDVNGYYADPTATPNGLQFYPLPNCRIIDTRLNPTLTLVANSVTNFPITGSCNIPDSAVAFSLNLTGVFPDADITVTAYSSDFSTPPGTTNLSLPAGGVSASAAVVTSGSGGQISVSANANMDLIIDTTGYFAPPSQGGLDFYPLANPCRVFDSCVSSGPFSGLQPVTVSGGSCGIPTAQAYAMNLAVVTPDSNGVGYSLVGNAVSSSTTASTLNCDAGGSVCSNMAISGATSGVVDIYNSDPTDALLDVYGYFDVGATPSGAAAQALRLSAKAKTLSKKSAATTPAASQTITATNTRKGIFALFGLQPKKSNAANIQPTAAAPTTSPSGFTGYLVPYGGPLQAVTGSSPVILPLRVHYPEGASQLSYLALNLNSAVTGKTEYIVYAESNGRGGYSLRAYTGDLSVVAPPPPFSEMSPSGVTVPIASPITVGALSITAYKFALVGDEFQLDLTVQRTGKFADQIVVYGVAGNTFSQPPDTPTAKWSSQ